MNCAKGDLAILVHDLWIEDIFTGERRVFQPAGLVMTCETLEADGCWRLEKPRAFTVRFDGPVRVLIAGVLTAISDSSLRPIRDPGDDAVDEMVRLVGEAPRTLTEVREVQHG